MRRLLRKVESALRYLEVEWTRANHGSTYERILWNAITNLEICREAIEEREDPESSD